MSEEPIWLETREGEFINHQLVSAFGGLAGGVRDYTLLEAAVARPLNHWAYGEPPPDLFDLAAAYCFGVCKGHAFHDGKKRTAHAAATVFLLNNGFRHETDESDVVSMVVALAEDQVSESDMAEWFRRTSVSI